MRYYTGKQSEAGAQDRRAFLFTEQQRSSSLKSQELNFFSLLCAPHRKLSLSTNGIEKIANLNGLSEWQTHTHTHCMAQRVYKSV